MKAKDVSIIALAVAIFTLCSWIALPVGDVPITLQIFALCFLSALLGASKSFFALLAYLLLGAIGVPVFSGFTGGVGRLLSPTGGYLLGFVIAAPCIGWWTNKKTGRQTQSRARLFIGMAMGVVISYVIGTLWFWVWLPQEGLWVALTVSVFPFVLLDVLKILLALWLYLRARLFLKNKG